jgi:hypothetical protein
VEGTEDTPIEAFDLPTKELRQKYNTLTEEIRDFWRLDKTCVEAAGKVLSELIKQEVTAHTILARAVNNDGTRTLLYELFKVISYFGTSVCHDGLKCLIETNPYALLWRGCHSYGYWNVIRCILGDVSQCDLLLWVMEKYPWIFEHPSFDISDDSLPVHRKLAWLHAYYGCEPSIICQFLEFCPKRLLKKEPIGFLLHEIVNGHEECCAELFMWMADKNPEAISHTQLLLFDINALHFVCLNLSRSQCTENMTKICRFLVTKYPELVRTEGNISKGVLPIHYLSHRCNRPFVQEIIILLLKEFPG